MVILKFSMDPGGELTFVTWNIDGLHPHLLRERTEAVIVTLTKMSADIVFLQEVIPETFSIIKSQMTNYECIAAKQTEYFVATLLRRGRMSLVRHKVVNFPNTMMDRHVLAVQVRIKIKYHCTSTLHYMMTSH